MGRFGKQTRLGELAVNQFMARLSEPPLAWASTKLHPDTGSDLHVEVFDDGNTTGLRFEVQMKGTASLGDTPAD